MADQVSSHVDTTAQETECSGWASMGYVFLAGALVGAGAALLFAPQTGAETRKQLADYGRRSSSWASAAYAAMSGQSAAEAEPQVNEGLKQNERAEAFAMHRA